MGVRIAVDVSIGDPLFDPAIVLPDKMGQYFGVGGRAEGMPFEAFANLLVILYHPVVDHGDSAALVLMWMRILIGRRPVRGPARVPNPDAPDERLAVHKFRQPLIDFALFLAGFYLVIAKNRQARAVVTSVFKTAQPFEQDGSCLLFTDVSDDAAHSGSFSQYTIGSQLR